MRFKAIHLAAALAICLLAVSDAPGQGATVRQFGEEIDVHEVRLTVRVDSRRGTAIEGLTAGDFAVFEDGSPLEIVDFRLLASESGAASSRPPGGWQSSERAAAPGGAIQSEESELVVLLFDLQGPLPRLVRAVSKALRWVDSNAAEVAERTWIVAVLDGTVELISDRTTDPEKLGEAIARVKESRIRDRVWRFVESPAASPWVQESRAYNASVAGRETPSGDDIVERMLGRQACLGQRKWMFAQIDSVQQLVESLASISGRKTIVWMHSSERYRYPEKCEDWEILPVTQGMHDLGALAAASGVVVHASNLEGLELEYGSADSRGELTGQNMASHPVASGYEHVLTLGTMARNMAGYTGGQRLAANDPTSIFGRAFGGSVYEITVLVPHGRDGLKHSFDVKLEGHRGAVVHYPRSRLDLSQRELLLNQLERFSLLPGNYGAFPVQLRGVETLVGEQTAVRITISVPAVNVDLLERDGRLVAELDPYVAVHTLAGELIEVRQIDSSELRLPNTGEIGPSATVSADTIIKLSPGEYFITGAFHDRLNDTYGLTSGRIGLSQLATIEE